MAEDSVFPIVGIGASAGGLQAIKQFFERMPADTGMAFVIVTHLPMGRESDLPEIVGRYTKIPTRVARADHVIEPDHVYVSPPDHILTVEQGHLRLKAREDAIQRNPIDVFFSSLANDRGEAAVGVLLSGSGSDGSLGMKAIKERGGFTLAQGADGSGPQHGEMPGAAISSGVVDLVVSAEDMAPRLVQFARTFEPPDDEGAESPEESFAEQQQAIAKILLRQVGHDFSGYKQKTFQRRVRRRMQVLQVDETADYISRLREDPEEAGSLFRDLLIGVTSFFRDPEAFDALERLVIPQLFANKGANDAIRVWVPGCATGEEVYSIAMLLRERMETLKVAPKIQVFATDIDEAALAVARAGRYPAPLMTNVSANRLKRFFTSDDVTFAVNKEIRDLCIFSSHSVLRDPPFSRIDLISCRNLLIYLGADFQAQVIPVFHFALKPHGFLFLGTSENVGAHTDLFAPTDKKRRIFQRRDQIVAPLQIPAFAPHGLRGAMPSEHRREAISGAVNLRRAVETLVLERFAPARSRRDSPTGAARAPRGRRRRPQPAGRSLGRAHQRKRRGLSLPRGVQGCGGTRHSGGVCSTAGGERR
jgi:two-component system CheB/CheR fusion protein